MASGSGIVLSSVRDILHVVFRHKWMIVGFFLLVVSTVTAYTYLTQEVYQSEAKLLIRLGRENLSMDASISGPTMSINRDTESEVNSELEIFTSRELAETLVKEMGESAFLSKSDETATGGAAQQELRLVRHAMRAAKSMAKRALIALDIKSDLTPHQKAVSAIMKSFSVDVEKRTSVITARFEAGNPDLAQKTLDNLVRLYQEHHIRVHANQASSEFFEEQAENLRRELTEREKRLDEFRTLHGITAMEPQKQALLQQITSLEAQVNEAAGQVSSIQAQVAGLEKVLQGHSKMLEISRTSGRANNAADAMKTRLIDLRLKESDMAARYPDTHRALLELRGQIKQIETTLAKETETLTEVTTGVDTNFQQLQLDLDKMRSTLKAEQARQEVTALELARQREQMNALASGETALKTLQRDVELAEVEYRQYRDNVQRAKISTAMDLGKVSNVSVVEAATRPNDPVRPKKTLNLALGFVVGLLGGICLAFLLEFLDDTLNTKEAAEKRLGVPVLAAISEKEFDACT